MTGQLFDCSWIRGCGWPPEQVSSISDVESDLWNRTSTTSGPLFRTAVVYPLFGVAYLSNTELSLHCTPTVPPFIRYVYVG
jgi:hypothetical protein